MLSSLRRLTLVTLFALVGLLPACSGAAPSAPASTLPTATIGEPASAPTPAADAASLAIDAAASKVSFTGRKVTGVHTGGFRAFDGEVRVGSGVADSGVSFAIDMDSVFSDSDRLTGHLKSADFFDVTAHPKATFVSTSVVAGGAGGATHTVSGNLTLHGVTKGISFPATIAASKEKVTLQAAFALDRKAFGVNYPGKANDLIADHVDLAFDLVAAPKAAAPAEAPAAPAAPAEAPAAPVAPAAPAAPAAPTATH